MTNAFAEKRVVEPTHDEIYRGQPLEVYALSTESYFVVIENKIQFDKQTFETVQDAMRAGRQLIDELIKKEISFFGS